MRRWMGRIGYFSRKLWRFFGDMRLAVILFIAVAVFPLLGTFFPQQPPELAADAVASAGWWAAVQARYGPPSRLYAALGLFTLHDAVLLKFLLVGLLLNTAVCTANRLPALRRALVSPQVVQPEAFFSVLEHNAQVSIPSRQQAVNALTNILRRHRYRLLWREGDEGVALHASRNHIGALGTQITHWSLTLLVVSLVWMCPLAWREEITLGPGQTRALRHRPTVQVRAERLVIERLPDGVPRQYWAPVTVLADGIATTREVWLNQPLVVKEIGYYLASYGPALRVTATDATGRRLRLVAGNGFPDEEAILLFQEEGDFREVSIPSVKLSLQVSYTSGEGSAGLSTVSIRLVQEGRVGPAVSKRVVAGEALVWEGIALTFIPTDYVVLLAVYDPSFITVILSALGLMVGLMLSFYLPHQRLWARVTPDSRLLLAGMAEGDWLGFDRHFARLVAIIKEETAHGGA
jgi:cytochrome c biogenesis protein